MRRMMVEAEVSVDGIMGGQSPDFWQEAFKFHSPDVQKYLNELLFTPDALVMGRTTYEFFAQVWPARKGEDAEKINRMPKYVASRTLKEPLQWNAHLLKEDVVAAIKKLKQEPGKGLLQYGVGELTHTMLKAGLVDEFFLTVYPFTVGEGQHIFEGMGANTLKLLDTRTFSSGVLGLHYAVER